MRSPIWLHANPVGPPPRRIRNALYCVGVRLYCLNISAIRRSNLSAARSMAMNAFSSKIGECFAHGLLAFLNSFVESIIVITNNDTRASCADWERGCWEDAELGVKLFGEENFSAELRAKVSRLRGFFDRH